MWTNNGKKLICKLLSTGFSVTSSDASSFIFTGSTGVDITASYDTNIDGVVNSTNQHIPEITSSVPSSSTSYYKKWCLYIGTGTTAPAEDDITLEAPVSFTCPVAPQISRGTNYTTLLITYTFNNDTAETKTITEIGLCARLNYATSGDGSPAILFNRRLLDNPVTMAPGDSAAFTFTIDTSNLTE